MRALSPTVRDGWLPAALIVGALAVFAALAFRVPGDLNRVPAAIDPDLVRTPPSGPGSGHPATGSAPVDPTRRGRLTVSVSGVRSARGAIVAALYTRGPLTGGEGILALQRAAAGPGTVRLVFDDVPRGTYAVTVFHDENGDGHLEQRGGGGPPVEGIGVSGAEGPPTGPPRFEDATFVLDRDALDLSIPLHYL
jgi:uncharacterized protein (DUF2141 family)